MNREFHEPQASSPEPPLIVLGPEGLDEGRVVSEGEALAAFEACLLALGFMVLVAWIFGV